MTTKLSLAAAVALFAGIASAQAGDTVRLSDAQLDEVTAGARMRNVTIAGQSGALSTGGCPPDVGCTVETYATIENTADVVNDQGWGFSGSWAHGYAIGGSGTGVQSEGFALLSITYTEDEF